MTPKKPTLTAARKEWLSSLKPGDSVLLWRRVEGWLMAICEDQRGYLNTLRRDKVILVRAVDQNSHMATSSVASKSGLSMLADRLDLVIFPSNDREALAAFWTDEQRRALRNVEWRKVEDSTVQRIADMLRLDAGKEPRP